MSKAKAKFKQSQRIKTAVQPPGVKVGMPRMSSDYLSKHKQEFLPWSHAEARLVRSHSYWICTTRADGRPHAMPVWGVWVEGAMYFGTGVETIKAKNITRNPAVVVHLESGDDMVHVEGTAEKADVADKVLCGKLNREYKRKYKMPMLGMPGSVIYRVRPRIVLAWQEKTFPYNSTRWEFVH